MRSIIINLTGSAILVGGAYYAQSETETFRNAATFAVWVMVLFEFIAGIIILRKSDEFVRDMVQRLKTPIVAKVAFWASGIAAIFLLAGQGKYVLASMLVIGRFFHTAKVDLAFGRGRG